MQATPQRTPDLRRTATSPRRRLRPAVVPMITRIGTALVGGYVLASAVATLIARLLPVDRAEATSWGMILSFLVYAIAALWSFHERGVMRVVLGIWGGSVAIGLALALLGVRP